MDSNALPNQPAPQPVPTETLAPQPVKDVQVSNKPSKNKGLSLKILIGVVIVLLIGVAVAAYILINNQKASDSTAVAASSDNSAAATAAANAAKLNTSKAVASAQAVEIVAESYFAELGYYPASTVDLTTGTGDSQVPTDIVVIPSAATTVLNADNGTNHVTWSCLVTCTSTKGGKITYWDYVTSTVSTNVIYLGDATVRSTFVDPAS